MIDVDEVRDRPDTGRLFPDPIQFAAIQNEGNLERIERGKLMDDSVASRKKKVIPRRPVLVVDDGLFPQVSQHMAKGQFRTDGVPVEPLMGRDQKNTV
jgi:hypothetical protein